MSSEKTRTEVDAAFDALQKMHEVRLLEVKDGDGKAVQISARANGSGVVLEGVKKFFDEYRDRPERREGTAQLETLDAFIAHAERFKSMSSALFAKRGNAMSPKLVSVIDYHEAGETGTARFCKHRGNYDFPMSEEWTAWKQMNEKPMGLDQFAKFIEDRVADVIGHDLAVGKSLVFSKVHSVTYAEPARLLELSQGLKIHVSSTCQQARTLSSGEVQFTFKEEHSDDKGQPLKTPKAFLIQIPVFRSGDLYQLPAFIRYNLDRSSGELTWHYKLYRVDAAFDDAFGAACERAREATSLPLFYGSPEGG